jgi:hypothetical protein
MPYKKGISPHPDEKNVILGKILSDAGVASDTRPVHLAKLILPEGDISPLCASKPRKLNLSVELWTNRAEAVTCKKCLAKLPGGTIGD